MSEQVEIPSGPITKRLSQADRYALERKQKVKKAQILDELEFTRNKRNEEAAKAAAAKRTRKIFSKGSGGLSRRIGENKPVI